MITSIEKPDLEHVLEHTAGLWNELKGEKIFITGGTGFIGRWLLESLLYAGERFNLGAQAYVLSRHPQVFSDKLPHLAGHPSIHLIEGDVRDFSGPAGEFSHIIHAATDVTTDIYRENPLLLLQTIVCGTQHVLEFAHKCGARKLLLTSSGAVYGEQPPGMTHLSEEFSGAPLTSDSGSAYGEGKRMAELLCMLYSRQFNLETKIARCFAVAGPHMPLNSRYAIGNFIRDAIEGGPIKINGDGTPYRSYLYAADLIIWLWTILFKGKPARPYNVGSDHGINIADLAKKVRELTGPHIEINIKEQAVEGALPRRYVPSIDRARSELGLEVLITLEEAIVRSRRWYAGNKVK